MIEASSSGGWLIVRPHDLAMCGERVLAGGGEAFRRAIGVDPVPIHENIGELDVAPRQGKFARVLHMVQKIIEEVSLALGLRVLCPGCLVVHRGCIGLFSEWHYP